MRLFYRNADDRDRDLIISAHGGKPASGDKIRWPIPGYEHTVLWCSAPGLSTTIQVADILQFRLNRTGRCVLYGYRALPIVHSISNYALEKYAATKSDDLGRDTYSGYERQAVNDGCDILSPRNRWFSRDIDLAYVLNHSTIRRKNYRNIYFSFCLS
jgi:hypothetical protein